MSNHFGKDNLKIDSISYDDILREAMNGDDKSNSCIIAMPSADGLTALCSMTANGTDGKMTVVLTKEGKSLYQNAFGKNVHADQPFELDYSELPKEKFAKLIGVNGPISETSSFADIIKTAKKDNAYGLIVGKDLMDIERNSSKQDIPLVETIKPGKVMTGNEKYYLSGSSVKLVSVETRGNSISENALMSDQKILAVEHAALHAMHSMGANVAIAILKHSDDKSKTHLITRETIDRSIDVVFHGSDYFGCEVSKNHSQQLSIPVSVVSSFVTGNFDGNTDESVFLSKFALRLSEKKQENYFASVMFQKMIGCDTENKSPSNFNLTVTDNGIKADLPSIPAPSMSIIKDFSRTNMMYLGMNGAGPDNSSDEHMRKADPVLNALHKSNPEIFDSAYNKAKDTFNDFLNNLEKKLIPSGLISQSDFDNIKGALTGTIQPESALKNVSEVKVEDTENKNDIIQRRRYREIEGPIL